MSRSRIIALGFFDGVHLGHAGLLRRVRELADQTGFTASALTFESHPDALVHGEQMALLSTPQDRESLMRRLYGIDEVLVLPFDRTLMTTSWQDFITEILIGRFQAAHVVCGHDFRFGWKGLGTASLLQQFCLQNGIGCDVIPEIDMDGSAVSSTRIRTLITSGQPEQAMRLLGHPHCMTGIVVPGNQLGRTIGIPTANLHIPDSVIVPAFGVYASRITIGNGVYEAVTNVGCRPTVSNSKHVTVEPWILDFDRDIYGKEIRIDYYRHLRGERKFDGLSALQAEIRRNAQQTRDYFKTLEA